MFCTVLKSNCQFGITLVRNFVHLKSCAKTNLGRNLCTKVVDCQQIAALNNGQLKFGGFRILKTTGIGSVNVNTINESNVELDDLELCINGEKMVLNLTWLRDSCHCFRCTHKYSRQRLMIAKDFYKSMFAFKDCYLSSKCQQDVYLPTSPSGSSGFLNIVWSDGHESAYSLSWLRHVESLYSLTKSQLDTYQQAEFKFPEDDFYLPTKNNRPKHIHWNISQLNSLLSPINYDDLVDNCDQKNNNSNYINANNIAEMSLRRLKALKSFLEQFVTLGLVKVENVPKERDQVLKLARSLAYERPTGYGAVFDVVVEPNEDINLAYSALDFDLHTDLTYRELSPGVQQLHCIKDSENGGLSYFSDAFKAANLLKQSDPDLYNVLLQFPVTFVIRDSYRDVKFRHHRPIIKLDYSGNLSDINYSPFMLPPIGFKDDVKLFYLAYDKFTQLLHSKENKYTIKMNPGDLFIFHNRRVLHGRSAYDPTSERFLQGCYLDLDEIECLYEKLVSFRPCIE